MILCANPLFIKLILQTSQHFLIMQHTSPQNRDISLHTHDTVTPPKRSNNFILSNIHSTFKFPQLPIQCLFTLSDSPSGIQLSSPIAVSCPVIAGSSNVKVPAAPFVWTRCLERCSTFGCASFFPHDIIKSVPPSLASPINQS